MANYYKDFQNIKKDKKDDKEGEKCLKNWLYIFRRCDRGDGQSMKDHDRIFHQALYHNLIALQLK